MLRASRILLVALILSAGGGTPRAATDSPDCSRSLTLGLHEHGLLYSAETDSGIDKDLSDELIRRSGCAITTLVMPRARIWQLIESGAMDFSLSGIANAERNRFAAFAWYFSNKYYLLLRNDTDVRRIADFERGDRLRLGVIRSFRFGENANRMVDRLQEERRVIYATGLAPLYETLLNNQIQGMIVEPFDYPVLQQDRIREITTILEFDDPSIPHGLIMSKKSVSDEEQKKWRKIVDEMRSDGTLYGILLKYLPKEIADAMINI
ncbi:substrate-binding periplasmic protein [Telmatospirillum siberiense]|uniref:ABC transporter substrate-binding protein n=1 Tax=Telmatospirillum siberiense TaxID=382514 RepID=A0A2N3PYL7_9PROT|nr:transporter substrate-binding domain-containing protein [Telmatospirillum siberiense]PKU25493.1 ABC transporter substrate-binding protein [Telmatospirillum siberiense]